MRKDNTLYCDRRTMDIGYIFFSDSKKAKKMIEILQQLNMRNVRFIEKSDGNIRYGFKIFKVKRKFFKFCVLLKEVTE